MSQKPSYGRHSTGRCSNIKKAHEKRDWPFWNLPTTIANIHPLACHPFKATYGYGPLIPLDISLENNEGKNQLSFEMLQEMDDGKKHCKDNLEIAPAKAKLYVDQNSTPRMSK